VLHLSALKRCAFRARHGLIPNRQRAYSFLEAPHQTGPTVWAAPTSASDAKGDSVYRIMMATLLLSVGVLAASGGTTFIETFSGGSNVGGWTYFAPNEIIDQTGGNLPPYLHAWNLDTYAPQPRTTQTASAYNGNYRQRQVSSVGVDLITNAVDFSAGGRPLALMLFDDNDTPGDGSDDSAAYTLGANIPEPGQGWRSFDFVVPSQSLTVPAGWDLLAAGPSSTPDWNRIVTDVDALGFFYGDPTMFFIFQMWNVGMDNPRITCIPEPASLLLLGLGLLLRRR
jgi:hypothetical protein